MGLFSDVWDHLTTPPERDRGGMRGDDMGPRFDPRRPWFLAGYRSGGGKNKNVIFFATQEQAASAMRQAIRTESNPEESYGGGSGRYVYKMGVARHQYELDRLLDRSMSRSEYMNLASKQAMVAPTLARRCGCSSRRR
jgi:hypothetical protein